MAKNITHLAYLFPNDKDVKVGDKVETLCGKKKRVHTPDDRDVCGACFRVFSADSFRTGTAVEVIMDTISGLTEVLNNGRKEYIANVGDNIILSGMPVIPKELA